MDRRPRKANCDLASASLNQKSWMRFSNGGAQPTADGAGSRHLLRRVSRSLLPRRDSDADARHSCDLLRWTGFGKATRPLAHASLCLRPVSQILKVRARFAFWLSKLSAHSGIEAISRTAVFRGVMLRRWSAQCALGRTESVKDRSGGTFCFDFIAAS